MGMIEIGFALGGFLVIASVIIVSKYPVYALQKRLKKFNIFISTDEAKKLSNFYELNDDFLIDTKQIIDFDNKVSFVSLADYHRNIGNYDRLNEAISTVKESGKKIPVNSIIMLLMTNKGVNKALELVGKTYNIEVKGQKEDGITVDYKVDFKIEYEQSLWLVNNLDLIIKTVKSSISLCIVSSEDKSAKNIESELLNNYLNEDFWMNNASGIVVNQELKVS